jgi:hypothetical protein
MLACAKEVLFSRGHALYFPVWGKVHGGSCRPQHLRLSHMRLPGSIAVRQQADFVVGREGITSTTHSAWCFAPRCSMHDGPGPRRYRQRHAGQGAAVSTRAPAAQRLTRDASDLGAQCIVAVKITSFALVQPEQPGASALHVVSNWRQRTMHAAAFACTINLGPSFLDYLSSSRQASNASVSSPWAPPAGRRAAAPLCASQRRPRRRCQAWAHPGSRSRRPRLQGAQPGCGEGAGCRVRGQGHVQGYVQAAQGRGGNHRVPLGPVHPGCRQEEVPWLPLRGGGLLGSGGTQQRRCAGNLAAFATVVDQQCISASSSLDCPPPITLPACVACLQLRMRAWSCPSPAAPAPAAPAAAGCWRGLWTRAISFSWMRSRWVGRALLVWLQGWS